LWQKWGNHIIELLNTRNILRESNSGGLLMKTKKIVSFIKKETDYWFDYNMDEYGIPGYYNWDVIAAAYMLHPELFENQKIDFKITQEDLQTGKLTQSKNEMERNCTLEIPVIGEELAFTKNIYDTWLEVEF